jgi:hypothetical protein
LVCSDRDEAAKKLAEEEKVLNHKLDEIDGRLKTLGGTLDGLELKQSEYKNVQKMAKRIEIEALNLRKEAQGILSELRIARAALTSSETNLRSIARELEDVGYAESRREMATRLREVMNLIQGVRDMRNIHLEKPALDQAFGKLASIDLYTPRVLRIVEDI